MRLTTLLLAPALLLALAPAAAAQTRNPGQHALDEGRLALQGHDPVSYFDVGGGTPRRGLAEHTVDHEGVVYRFASAANQATFEADPARFEPAHGGWCSYAMSFGKQVRVDPLAFRVAQGRLLLFASKDHVQVDSDWVEDEPALLRKADAAWKTLSGESPRLAPADSWRPTREFNLSGASLALEGYDPVAYFPEGGGEPTEGTARHALRHGGVLYHFANAANRERFRADPAKYEPQHGGWCSYAMGAGGDRVDVDPEAFRLTDGQLHLFYNGWLGDTRDDWDDDTAALKAKADSHWAEQVAAAKQAIVEAR